MVVPVVLVNVFFVPVITLWIYCKKNSIVFLPTLNLFAYYAIFTVYNIPLTKVGNVLAKWFLKREIAIDSGYYTVLAVIAAAILPFLYEKGRLLYENRGTILKTRTLKYNQKLAIIFLPVLLLALIYGILNPLEIYSANVEEVVFKVGDFLPQMIVISVVVLLVSICLLALLPDWLFRIASAMVLWIGISSWVQNLFLNIRLSEPDGGWLQWENLGRFPEIDLLIWLAILVCVLVMCIRLKSWGAFIKLTACGLCVVQIAALVSVCVTMPEPVHGELALSGDNQMKLASGENLIIFMLDSVDNMLLEELFQEAPEMADVVKDFEWYTNADNRYYYTFPSVTHFLTGYQFDFDKFAMDWLQDAWNSEQTGKLYDAIAEAGYRRELYLDPSELGYIFGGVDNTNGKFENVQEVECEINTQLLLKKMGKLSLYRGVPYVIKKPFEVLTSELQGVSTPVDSNPIASFNYDFFQRLSEERISVDPDMEKLFTFQILDGIHVPYQTGRDGTYQEESTIEDVTCGLFTIMQEYFRQMKELNVYDDATIIIMADHGRNPDYVGKKLYQPIFLLKRAGEEHDQFITNSAPVYYDDFPATIMELTGKNDGTFGTSFFDWQSGDERQRTLYVRQKDLNYPERAGSSWNCYYAYTHYKDQSDLEDLCLNEKHDSVVVSYRR